MFVFRKLFHTCGLEPLSNMPDIYVPCEIHIMDNVLGLSIKCALEQVLYYQSLPNAVNVLLLIGQDYCINLQEFLK